MIAPTRLAGSGRLADGRVVTWAVADGRRGRRWREVVSDGASVVHSLLLETDIDRRFSHLELARADGLWTLHPEGDGALHGNHVGGDASGIHHVSGPPFGRDDVVIVDGSPLSQAALVWGLAGSVEDRDETVVQGVRIASSGAFDAIVGIRVGRSRQMWQVGEGSPFEIDRAGLPVLKDGRRWPLESG